MSDEDFNCAGCMSLLQIRELFSFHGSFLSGVIPDVDGQPIDPAQLVYDASQTYGINPQILIARMQTEQSAVTMRPRPKIESLMRLTGCLTPAVMRVQIACAALKLREYFDAQLPPNGHTVSGWRVGEPRQTGNTNPNNIDPPEGLWVTPATMAVAALYTFTPYRGRGWNGSSEAGGNQLLVRMIRKKLKLHALMPYFTGHELYDEQGNVTFRFLTPNPRDW
ncbi:MAG: hypothetical protein IPJ98_10975 [Bryobacterales bacterium]|nr:hypothetical protein [Bryobacterales bacterium]